MGVIAMKQKTSFTKLIKQWGIVLITGIAVSITVIDIVASYHSFNLRRGRMRADYIRNQKQMIKQEVNQVVSTINYKKTQTEEETRSRLRKRVYEAYSITEHIYEQNKEKKSIAEIEQMIVDALRPIRFGEGKGYYFITRLDGVGVMVVDDTEKERVSLLDIQDRSGQYIIKDMIAIGTEIGEGYYEYYCHKPDNVEGNEFKKISFVKQFTSLDWVIGTGLYVDDIEGQIKRDLLIAISRIRFDKEGYIFINRLNGDALVSNGEVFSGTKKLWEEFDKYPEKIKDVFSKEYEAALKPNGDYIYYSWKKLTESKKESPKVSFIYGIAEWQWLVGAGVYLDDVEADISLIQGEMSKNIRTKIFYFTLISLGLITIFLYLFNRLNKSLRQDLRLFISFFSQAAVSDELIVRDEIEFKELDMLAQNANKMLENKKHAEEDLKAEREHLFESEAKFRGLVETSSDWIWETDAAGIYTYASPQVETILGYKPCEIVGRSVFSLMEPEEAKRIGEIFKSVSLRGEAIVTLENRSIHKKGHEVVIETSGIPIKNINGKVTGYRGVDRDITERNRIEESLLEQKRLTDLILTASSIGLTMSHDRKIIWSNEAMARMFGYSRIDFEGQEADILYPTKVEYDRVGKLLYEPRNRDKTVELDAEFIRKDGSIFYGQYRVSYFDSSDPSKGIILSLIDITERKRAEEHIGLLAEMLDKAPNSIIIHDYAGRIIYANQKTFEMHGYSKDEFMVLRLEEIDTAESRKDISTRIEEVIAKGEISFEVYHNRKDGTAFPMLIYLKKIEWAGEPALLSIGTDIRDRKASEHERERLLRNVSAKNEELESIIYVSSHDLRSPLINIQGYSSELVCICSEMVDILTDERIPADIKDKLSKMLNEEIPGSVDYIISSATKMGILLQGLLRLCRLGRAALTIVEIDVNSMFVDIRAAMQYQIAKAGIKLEVDELPRCFGDAGQVNQVFTNLVDNAIKYRDRDRVGIIHVSGHTKGKMSIYCVEDNGVGISMAYKKKVFEIFHRLNPESAVKGEGLGLTIVQRIVERHNGKVWFESKLGRGSRFFVSLPNKRPEIGD
jgi:PAS domain S-box-containing protein